MLSRGQISRMIEQEGYRRLVERVLANGRCRSQAARRRLQEPRAVAPAGLGLALQRLCELVYATGELEDSITGRLIRLQRGDGLFGGGPSPHPAASAAVLAGLLAWRRLAVSAHGGDLRMEADRAIERGLRALTERLRRADDLDVEIVVWQLGREEAFRVQPVFAEAARRVRAVTRGKDELPAFALAAAA